MSTVPGLAPPLADWQRDFANAIVHGDASAVERLLPALATGPVPLAAALEIHAGAVHQALYSALKGRVPTLLALVGDGPLRELVRDYARRHPPRQPQLALWGEALPAFLADHPASCHRPVLASVAAFDLALDEVALAPPGEWLPPVVLAPGLQSQALASLRVFSANHAVHEVRDAVASGIATEPVLQGDWPPEGHWHYALWCAADSQVHCLLVSAGVAAFLAAMADSSPDAGAVEAALQAALTAAGTADSDAAMFLTELLRELAGIGGLRLAAIDAGD